MFALRSFRLPAAASCLICAFALAATETKAADSGNLPGEIKFVGSNRLVTANGSFRRWKTTKAELSREAGEISLDIRVEVDTASIDTGNSQRDNHLRSADFFHVSKYPTAALRLYNAKPQGEAKRNVQPCTGKLEFEMHGQKHTYDVTFDLVDGDKPYVRGKITIDRNDFGVGAPYRGGLLSVYNAVRISYSCLVE